MRKLPFERLIRRKRSVLMLRLARAFGVQIQNVRNHSLIAGTQQAENMDQACKGTSGESAAAKAEQIDFVTVNVSVHQKAIGVADIVEQACAESEALDARPFLFDTISAVRRTHGSHAGMVVADLVLIDLQTAIELRDI